MSIQRKTAETTTRVAKLVKSFGDSTTSVAKLVKSFGDAASRKSPRLSLQQAGNSTNRKSWRLSLHQAGDSTSRKSRRLSLQHVAAVLLFTLTITGCETDSPDATSTAPADSPYVLSTQPADPVSIADAKASIESQTDVTIIGRINAGDHDPFESGKATFLMRTDPSASLDPDIAEASHDKPGHDPSTCPFCKSRAGEKEAIAIVNFRDDTGKTIATDARKLLGIKKDQIVIVQGTASVDALDNLIVNATGVFVVR